MCALELGARMARNRMAVGDGRTRNTLINVNQP